MRVTPRVLGIFLLAVLWLPGSPLGIRYDRPTSSGRGERIYLQQQLGPACTLTEPLRCLRAVRVASTLAQASGAEPQGEPTLRARRDPLPRSASQATALLNLDTGHLHFLGLPVARPRAPCPVGTESVRTRRMPRETSSRARWLAATRLTPFRIILCSQHKQRRGLFGPLWQVWRSLPSCISA